MKTATGSQAFPDLNQVLIMKENLSGKTKIKVSGVPRTFTLPAVLYMIEEIGVELVGTRSAGKLVEQYENYWQHRANRSRRYKYRFCGNLWGGL